MPTLSLLEGISVFMRLSVSHILSEKHLSPISMAYVIEEMFPVCVTY